ncbi:hypothetical protein [Shewanella sp.]|uniref:hypothetical protein n=1 Tax=Shewanella sp. TaxID=50422 RepID=UPI003A984C7A
MISLLIFAVLLSFYFRYNEGDTSVKEAVAAMLLYAVYWVIYVFVPPFAPISSSHLGKLFGMVPLVALGAILFPYFNRHAPLMVTRGLGWLGLAFVSSSLLYSKFVLW